MLHSLLIDLSTQSDNHLFILSRLYAAHDGGVQTPSHGVLTKCFKDMLSVARQKPVYVIIGALDECPDTSRMIS